MRSVGLKVLKNKLSEYVRMAASGETVLVTDRGAVVAELVPPQPGRTDLSPEARWAELIRQGIVRPATRKGPLPPRKPLPDGDQLLNQFLRDRDDE